MDRAAPPPAKTSRRRPLPPVYLLGAILLMLALHLVAPGGRVVRTPWRYFGIAPIVLGCSIVVACAMSFRRHNTTIRPFEVSSALISSGLYRYSRNPIYLAMLVVLGGVAILLGSMSPWLVLPLFAWAIQVRFIRIEEAMLAAAFPDDYAAYCRRTRRWL